jgi:16S rRNA processing protein RimM
MSTVDELVVLGRISGTHGIRGELKVHSYSEDAVTLQRAAFVLLRMPDGTLEPYAVAAVRASGKKVLLSLQGFDSINQVQHLIGREVCVRRDQLPPLDEDEYYWHDLLGMSVVTATGQPLGVVKDIFATGSNDVYVVRQGRREYMIPALEDVVVHIDLVQRVMTISPFEGLLDL